MLSWWPFIFTPSNTFTDDTSINHSVHSETYLHLSLVSIVSFVSMYHLLAPFSSSSMRQLFRSLAIIISLWVCGAVSPWIAKLRDNLYRVISDISPSFAFVCSLFFGATSCNLYYHVHYQPFLNAVSMIGAREFEMITSLPAQLWHNPWLRRLKLSLGSPTPMSLDWYSMCFL